MNYLVKFLTDDDGYEYTNTYWHYVVKHDGSPRALCTGECFGSGEGGATFKDKSTERGGITCPTCLGIIRDMKKIKL